MINYVLAIVVFCLSLGISFLFTPLVCKIAIKRGILSRPDRRMIHTKPIPYLGGVAIYIAFAVGVLVVLFVNQQIRFEFSNQLQGIILASTFIVILGLWDDIKNIRPRVKLISQLAIAFLLFGYGFRVEVLTNPFLGGEMKIPLVLSAVITIIWFLGMINAMNLIDGLDGLAAGITVIVSFALISVSLFLGNYINVLLLAALAGSALGFLYFNFYPARIFMGDTGSMLLGLIIASVALLGSQHKAATAVVLLTPITALALPIFDTFMAITRRASRRRSIFKPDRKHLHHRLLEIGMGQKQIVLFLYMITAYLGIFAFLFVLIPEQYALVLLVLLALGLFMGIKTVTFIERKAKLIHRLKVERRRH